MRKLLLSAFILLNVMQVAHAHRGGSDNEETPDNTGTEETVVNNNQPILVIGASFGSGNTPFDSGLSAPLLGLAVAGGNYLSLGDALVRAPSHNGRVINEAQAGSTTFARPSCRDALYAGACSTAEFNSYETQLTRAASRVRSLSTGAYNAEYVIITAPNDCLHSDAFGRPESEAIRCDMEDMYDLADRLMQVGELALSMGLMPVFADYPPVESIDLELFRQSSLLTWTITESDYSLLNETVMGTLRAELPEATFINYFETYEQLGDGIHPTDATSANAANIILQEIGYAVEPVVIGDDNDDTCEASDDHGHDRHSWFGKLSKFINDSKHKHGKKKHKKHGKHKGHHSHHGHSHDDCEDDHQNDDDCDDEIFQPL